jgi:hypothetical protein
VVLIVASIRWDILQPNEPRKLNSLENSSIEKLSVLVVAISYGRFIVPMTFFVLSTLTPKGPRSFFGLFLKFGQAIVDVIFVQKISNFQ